ncbi:phosphoadenylyl-sulfate reductase [Sphingobacterium sp. xlx-130]|uniref:phosphoadenylyl-sulfate reductase n=1 Tax=Sphingobacterium sp. xlx-130 TaxID=2654323 RepID=UPI0013D9436A|nr:phosphoadenylyl-sulfate reductase [Sphingobacterium sp. xlx-130]
MIDLLKNALAGLDAAQIVSYIAQNYSGRTVFSTSFGIEDQVITAMLSKEPRQVSIFTLETGRLFPETYYVWNRTLERYGLRIKAFYPQADAVEAMVSDKGPSSFYESVANKKECCFIRKIEPLQRAIKGFDIWITGIRAEQSANREEMDFIEWDAVNSIVKVHPLFYWSLEDVEAFLKQFNVPYNPLHDKGFPSIGCQPCTRAIKKGEDFRAGRWWWEDKSKKECGLHGGS